MFIRASSRIASPDESGYESIVWRVSPTTPPFTDKQGQYLASSTPIAVSSASRPRKPTCSGTSKSRLPACTRWCSPSNAPASSGGPPGWHTEDLVEKYQVTRDAQDRWALRSQQHFA